jgi:hypothetical protein
VTIICASATVVATLRVQSADPLRSEILVLESLSFVCRIAVVAIVAGGWMAAASSAHADPLVVHVPAATAYYGKPIDVSAHAKCGDPQCAAAVVYRETSLSTEPARPWVRVGLSGAAADPAGFISFAGQIPGKDVSTRGVDYYLEVLDGAKVDHEPTTAPTTPYHVHTVSPPVISHVPPGYAQADQPMHLTMQSTCSTGSCTATLFFRTSPAGSTAPASGVVSTGAPTVSINDDPRGWEHVSMSKTATTSLGDPGDLQTWAADVPARIVDTKGVDYVLSVADGKTTSWSPGSGYQGYLPQDGTPVSAYHTHVVEPPRIVHVPPATAPYRKAIAITGTSTCPIGRTCTARLYYRTTTSTILDSLDTFNSAAMTVTAATAVGSLGTVTVTGSIPATVVDTRGVDYFFSVSDGSRTAWWPGTSAVDGPISVDGTRVAYSHVRVLEAPHIVPQPVPTAKQLQPLTLTSTVTCATEHCDVELYYAQAYLNASPLQASRSYTKLAMTKVSDGPTTSLGTAATYQATIPAAAVTTRGLAWFIRAWDGYVQTFSPGTPYVGAYVPVGNRRPGSIQLFQAFPDSSHNITLNGNDLSVSLGGTGIVDTGLDLAWLTRILEPPHIVHAPVLTVAPDRQIAIDAWTNCITPACTGKLTWLDRTATEQTVDMKAEKAAPASVPATLQTDKQDVWHLSAVIPRRDVTDTSAPNYRITASDGYSSDTTPTYPVVVSDKGLGSIGGHTYTAKNAALFVDSDVDLSGLTVTATPVVGGTALPAAIAKDSSDSDGRYTISDLPSGQYDITVDPAGLPAGADRTAQPLTQRISVSLGQRVRGTDFDVKAVDRDHDELADFIEPRYGIPAGTNPDSDGDGLKDGFEVKKLYPDTKPDKDDTNNNGTSDAHEDLDHDGLDNLDEQFHGTNPRTKDSDGDGLTDGFEINRLYPEAIPTQKDTDGNGVADGAEDPDHDGLNNVGEQQQGVNPHVADTDDDQLKDGFEANRAFPFARPDRAVTTIGTPDAQADPDGDGLNNLTEQHYGSDPLSADGDQDGLLDADESAAGTDPDKADSDNDGLSDSTEVHGTTSPTNRDTDGDGILDGKDTTSATVTSNGVSVTLTGTGDLASALHIDQGGDVRPASGLGQVGATYDIHLDDDANAGFDHATVRLPYDPAHVPTTTGNLRIFTYDDQHGAWLPSSTNQAVDTTNHLVTAVTDHFSLYTVFDIQNWHQKWTTTVDGCDGNPPNVDLSIAFDVGYHTKSNDPGFALGKETARRFVTSLGALDRGAIAEIDDSYRVVTGLTADHNALNAGITDVHDYYGRPTDLEQVIEGGLAPLKAGGPRQLHRARMLILLTSGYSDYAFTGSSVYDASLGNVTIFPIAIGSSVDETQLREIADDTGGQYFHINATAELPDVLARASRQATHGDYDNDGLNDCEETDGMIDSATGKLFFSDPMNPDTDGDEIVDGEEIGPRASTADIERYGTNLGAEVGDIPVYNVLSDPMKVNSDADGLSDPEELAFESDARAADFDGDDLDDDLERDLGVDPFEPDTDGDGLKDGKEYQGIHDGLNPAIPTEHQSKLGYIRDFGLGVVCGTETPFCDRDNVPFLLGSLVSGIFVVGDLRDLAATLAQGDIVGAGISIGSLIPGFGDAANIGIKSFKYAEKHPDEAAKILEALTGVENVAKAEKLTALKNIIGEDVFTRLTTRIEEDDLLKFSKAGMDLKHLDEALEGAHEVTRGSGFVADWRVRETQLREATGSRPKGKTFQTSRGRRVADAYAPPDCVRESKNGFQASSKLLLQMFKDREITAPGNVYDLNADCLEWHFYPSAVSSTVGIETRLLHGELDEAGNVIRPGLLGDPANGIPPIKYVIHLP